MATNPHFQETSPGADFVGREVLEIDAETGVVRLAFLAREEFANRHGNVFGGFLAAMLDSAAAAPVLAILPEDRMLVTKSLEVSFEKPASLGRLYGTARVSEQDERTVRSAAELCDPEGNVVARATATFRILPRRRP